MADLRWKDCMLGQVSSIAGRQVMMTAAKMAELERHRSVEAVLGDLADELQVTDPGLARRLTDVLAVPAAKGASLRPVVLAFAPDNRWSTGWFMRAGQAVPQALPFAGWMLLARPDRPEQQVEASFLCHGRACSLSELQSLGFAFRGHS
ncbi:hypothetical protein AB0M28_12025 [Streptomyces sp. NPDC051940]|uniref:hypothetical protein n=1 Tax=Streptomyces sp. NPDC051940 TaxID=3155675 RepID=UPI003428A64C